MSRGPVVDPHALAARVHEKMHREDGTSAAHFAGAGCCCYTLENVVLATLLELSGQDYLSVFVEE